jgi:hypothetical protein
MGNEGLTHGTQQLLSLSRLTPSCNLQQCTLFLDRHQQTFTPPTLLSIYTNLQYPTPPPETHTALSTLMYTPHREISPPATSPSLPPFSTAKHKTDFMGPPLANTLTLLLIARGTRGLGRKCLGGKKPTHSTQQPLSPSLGAPVCGLR